MRGTVRAAPAAVQAEPIGEVEPQFLATNKRPPTDAEIEALPLSVFAEYDLSGKEIDRLRRRLYARNKTGKFFFRTTRFGGLLAVVRFM